MNPADIIYKDTLQNKEDTSINTNQKIKMAPRGQQSERRQAKTSHDDYKLNWNGQTDRQDIVFNQADTLTKKDLI